jgi:diamine N-acetyltransferase
VTERARPLVELRTVTEETFRPVIALAVSDEQKGFVATNVYSIAQTTVRPWARVRAVHADGAPVGLTMWGLDPEENAWWIYRLMVDRAHQGKGYGRAALRLVLDSIASERRGEDVFLSTVPHNAVARRLYESLGFRDTGRVEHGEAVMRWDAP